jgi:glycosyltransferase involved in cell wall biosynthesis
MIEVVHVFGVMDIGGAELRTIELFRALSPQEVHFHFVTLSAGHGTLDDDIVAMGGQVHPVPLDHNFPIAFLRLLKRLQPDVIDSHVATFSGVILFGAWIAKVKRRIAHFRSDGDGHGDSRRRTIQRRLMTLLIYLFATDIVGVSPSSLSSGYREDWSGDARARVITNGIPPFSSNASDANLRQLIGTDGCIVMMHVGRPSLEKNRIHAVRVLNSLRLKGVDVHLTLVGGQGPDTDGINAEIAQLGLEEYVHDLGARRDARSLMSQSDVLLLPSTREGLPGVVLESLSTGTPVVATDLPGLTYIGSELSGIWPISLSSSASDWADAVTEAVLKGRERSWRRALQTQFDTSHFSQTKSAEAHFRLYLGDRQDD